MKEKSKYIRECSEMYAESMGSDFIDLLEALNNTLYIGKYLRHRKRSYKKDKKRIKKVLKSTENGMFVKYIRECNISGECDD